MSRSIIQHRRWYLVPDAEPVTYRMECVVCGACSQERRDVAEPQQWTLQHSGRNPSHHTYREVINRPWRTWMS